MNRKSPLLLAVLASLLLASTAAACLWDSDTLQMERLRFPGVLEIITGKFVRHSKAYYEWRVTDRLKRLEASPDDPALIDDLAVAYDKLGQPEEGIVLLEKSLANNPDRYETLSNLATLLFHAGKLEESKQHVQRALEINPNAHFGREKYQLLLTEYVLQSELKTAGVMSTDERYPLTGTAGFARYVSRTPLENQGQMTPEELAELRRAGKGVLGMLHFADYRSPILLEALGDLLTTGYLEEDATQLAARGYLLAARYSDDPKAAVRYREMASMVVKNHLQFHENGGKKTIDDLEKQLSQEVVAGDSWFAEIQANESRWIADGRDVDSEFAAVYYDSLDETIAAAAKQVSSEPVEPRPTLSFSPRIPRLVVVSFWFVLAIVAVATVVVVSRWMRHRRRSSPAPAMSPSKPM